MSTPKQVKHWYGTRQQYDSIAAKDAGTVYFIADEGTVYRGDQPFGYTGPFSVQVVTSSGQNKRVSVESGAVVIGESRYAVQSASSVMLSAGYDLFLVGNSSAQSKFQYSAISSGASINSSSGTFYTKIAGNRGGIVRQFQFGEIVTVPWGISGGGSGGVTEEEVNSAISSALGVFADRYGLTPVPVIKYTAPDVVPSRSNTVISNTNVTLSAVNWEPEIVSKEYSTNGSSWMTYTNGGIVVSANGTRYFRGKDSSGDLTSTAVYTVTNIDKTGPTINLTGYNISAYTPQVISASTTEGGVQIYWSPNNANWSAYTSPVSATSSGTWYFSASDPYGNKTTKSLYFPNIGGSSGGSGGWDDDDQPEI